MFLVEKHEMPCRQVKKGKHECHKIPAMYSCRRVELRFSKQLLRDFFHLMVLICKVFISYSIFKVFTQNVFLWLRTLCRNKVKWWKSQEIIQVERILHDSYVGLKLGSYFYMIEENFQNNTFRCKKLATTVSDRNNEVLHVAWR